MPNDAANIIANTGRRASLLSEAFDRTGKDSIYAGASRDAAKNLYEIKVRN